MLVLCVARSAAAACRRAAAHNALLAGRGDGGKTTTRYHRYPFLHRAGGAFSYLLPRRARRLFHHIRHCYCSFIMPENRRCVRVFAYDVSQHLYRDARWNNLVYGRMNIHRNSACFTCAWHLLPQQHSPYAAFCHPLGLNCLDERQGGTLYAISTRGWVDGDISTAIPASALCLPSFTHIFSSTSTMPGACFSSFNATFGGAALEGIISGISPSRPPPLLRWRALRTALIAQRALRFPTACGGVPRSAEKRADIVYAFVTTGNSAAATAHNHLHLLLRKTRRPTFALLTLSSFYRWLAWTGRTFCVPSALHASDETGRVAFLAYTPPPLQTSLFFLLLVPPPAC